MPFLGQVLADTLRFKRAKRDVMQEMEMNHRLIAHMSTKELHEWKQRSPQSFELSCPVLWPIHFRKERKVCSKAQAERKWSFEDDCEDALQR